MNRAPSFQFYPDKFISGTLHLSDKAFKAYMRVLCWMWLHGEPQYAIVNEKNSICSASGLSKRVYEKVWLNEIMNPYHSMLKIEGNMLISNGLRKEFEKQQARRNAAKAGANARWGHDNSKPDAMPNVCTPSTTPVTSPSTTPYKEKETCNMGNSWTQEEWNVLQKHVSGNLYLWLNDATRKRGIEKHPPVRVLSAIWGVRTYMKAQKISETKTEDFGKLLFKSLSNTRWKDSDYDKAKKYFRDQGGLSMKNIMEGVSK